MKNRLAAALLALSAACGGGSSSSTPSSPSPTPTTPVSAACGAIGQQQTAIVNGSECSTATSPIVLLNMKDSTGDQLGSCSGTVIAARGILTAAHCLTSAVASIKIFRGTGEELVTKSFERHPSYRDSDNTSFDAGVVLTSDDIGRTPMPLLLSRDARVGETVVIAGWGKDQNQIAATLRAGTTTITVVSSLTLQTEFSASFSATCQGDSGGPLLLQEGSGWALAGIISANTTLACTFGTNYYANIRNADISSFILARIPDAARK